MVQNERLKPTEKKPHYDVVFALTGQSYTPWFVNSLAETLQFMDKQNLTYKVISSTMTPPRLAREDVMTLGDWMNIEDNVAFRDEFDYTKVFWVEPNMTWTAEDFFDLWRSRHKITSGWYVHPDRTTSYTLDGTTPVAMDEVSQAQKYIEVVTTGFGFLMVEKGIFESMAKPWFDNYILEHDGRLVSAISEETSWCIEAHNSGHSIWVDTSVRVGQSKSVIL